MPLFHTIIHPSDFDDASEEAFRVARSLAQAFGARVIAFHAVHPPAAVTRDGRVVPDPKHATPVDLWTRYRTLAADTPKVPVQYAVAVADRAEAKRLLQDKIGELGQGVLVVMGTHGRASVGNLLWGSLAGEAVRDLPCPVLVVKADPRVVFPTTAEPKIVAISF